MGFEKMQVWTWYHLHISEYMQQYFALTRNEGQARNKDCIVLLPGAL